MLTVFKISNKANTVEVRLSAHAQFAFIYTLSLTIHSFGPFQQFMSDNQKLDYQCDMARICQREISG